MKNKTKTLTSFGGRGTILAEKGYFIYIYIIMRSLIHGVGGCRTYFQGCVDKHFISHLKTRTPILSGSYDNILTLYSLGI